MDPARYDEHTVQLIGEVLAVRDVPDKRLMRKLAQLKKTATAMDDDYLLGFVYYHLAYAKYHLERDKNAYQKDLLKAVKYLLRCDDKALIARVYNLIAVDAWLCGCYDIAHRYYRNALHMDADCGGTIVSGIIEANLAGIFAELGDYQRARRHSLRSIRIIHEEHRDPSYIYYIPIAYLYDGMISIELNDIEAARNALKHAEEHAALRLSESDDRTTHDFLRARIAFADGDLETAHAVTARLIRSLSDVRNLLGLVDDISKFCAFLISANEFELAGRLIETVNGRILASGNATAMRALTENKVAYYEACGNDEGLKASLREQKIMLITQKNERERMARYTVELVQLDKLMRDEQQRIIEEKDELNRRLSLDALTGISNRYAMNLMLEETFERVYRERTVLGVEVMDIDYFKEFNDTYGHGAGDECLVAIASSLYEAQRTSGGSPVGLRVSRYGGDEFVLIYEAKDKDAILSAAQSVREGIDSLSIKHERSAVSSYVTVSRGLAIATPVRKNKVWDFLSAADTALFTVKKARGTKDAYPDGMLVVPLERAYRGGET